MSPAAHVARPPELSQLGLRLPLIALWDLRQKLVEGAKHPQHFAFAQASDALVKFEDRFPHHFALGQRKALGSVLKQGDGRLVEREGNLYSCHIATILPYYEWCRPSR